MAAAKAREERTPPTSNAASDIRRLKLTGTENWSSNA